MTDRTYGAVQPNINTDGRKTSSLTLIHSCTSVIVPPRKTKKIKKIKKKH